MRFRLGDNNNNMIHKRASVLSLPVNFATGDYKRKNKFTDLGDFWLVGLAQSDSRIESIRDARESRGFLRLRYIRANSCCS